MNKQYGNIQKLLRRFNPLIIIAGCYLISCAGIDHIPKQTLIEGIDLTKYSEKGFLITPGEYGEDYVSIGMCSFTVFPRADKLKVHSEFRRDWYEEEWKIEKIDLQEVMDLAYETALAKKANAITHLKIEPTQKTYADGPDTVTIHGIKVSGLLIRRK